MPSTPVEDYLDRLIAARRDQLVLDHRQVERALLRGFPERPRAVVLLHVAVREGVAAELAQGYGTELPQMALVRLTDRLVERAGFARRYAEWAVIAWARVLRRQVGRPTRPRQHWIAPDALRGHRRAVTGIVEAGEVIVTSSLDRSLRVWNTATGECERALLVAHRDWIRGLARSGPILASAGDDGRVQLWDEEDWSRTHQLVAGAPVTALACGPANTWLAAACADGRMRVWDLDRLAMLSERPMHPEQTAALAAVGGQLAFAGPQSLELIDPLGDTARTVSLPGVRLVAEVGPDALLAAGARSIAIASSGTGEIRYEHRFSKQITAVAGREGYVAVAAGRTLALLRSSGRQVLALDIAAEASALRFVGSRLAVGRVDGQVDFVDVR